MPLLLIQHPAEAKHSKNTADFLHACLAHSHLWVAETLNNSQCEALQQLPNPWLLYPHHPQLPAVPEPAKPPGCLVVIDATWRKSRKMLYLNPQLAHLPRLSFDAPGPSRYHIRRRPQPHHLSTFEASCYALAQLEEAPERYRPALTAFTRYLQQWAARVPPHNHNL